jgi:hypothetical protein
MRARPHITIRIAVTTAYSLTKVSLTHRISQNDDPACRVLKDRRSHDDLAQIAAHEVHLAHDHGDDLDRGDRQRGAQEQACDETLARMRQQRGGQEIAKRKATGERHGHPHRGNRKRGYADFLDQLEIGFHAGQQQEHHHAHICEAGDEIFLLRALRKKKIVRGGPYPTEQRRTEDQPGEQLPDDGRLAEALHDLAETAADQQKQGDLRDQ